MIKHVRWALAAVSVVLLLLPQAVAAVDYGGVGGKPAYPQAGNSRSQSIFIYQLAPGHSKSDGVEISNSTKDPQIVSVYPVDSIISSGGAFACAQQADARNGVGSWMTFSTGPVTLLPDQKEIVPFTVSVPDGAEVGEHDGCVVIQSQANTASGSTRGGVNLSFRSAIRVAVTIPGKIIKSLKLVGVTASSTDGGTYRISPTVENQGNVSLDTTVHAQLVPLAGAGTASQQGVYPVLPHSKATWNFDMPRPFWGGLYHAYAEVTYNSDTASAIGASGDGKEVTLRMMSAPMLVLPAPVAGIIELLVAAAVIGAAVLFGRQYLRKRHAARHWVEYTLENGDTLEGLAAEFHTSWRMIAKVNGLKPPYNLRKGRLIKLPPTE